MSLFTTAIRRAATLAIGTGILVGAAHATASDIVEYYHATLDHYFMTGYAPEVQALDAGRTTGWVRTGFTLQVFDAGDPRAANSVPVCRFYGNPARGLDSHFYSATPLECEDVQKKFPDEWKLESNDLFRVHAVDSSTGQCPANTKAVYRLYNRRADVNHRYTTDPAIVDQMVARGYVLEGNGSSARPVAFCAANIAPAAPVTGAPLCTITSSSTTPVVGVPVTLTATCTGSPTTFAWVNCTSTTATCTASATAVGSVNYSVVATNGSGTGVPGTLALNWQVAAAAAPTCTVSATTTTPQIGAPLTLSANCSHTPTRYEWLGCSALLIELCNPIAECRNSTTSCSPVGTQMGSVFYALRATNSAGTSSKSGVSVNWGGSSTPPPPTPPTPTTPVPVCSISASSSSPAVNTTLTLTASCTNSPTSFQWANCTSTTSTCSTTESTAVMRTYSVTGSNASGVGTPATLSVGWQQPPTAPPVCTVSANNPTPFVGGTVTLTATCTQSPTSYNWVGCSSTGSTCTASNANTGQASYSVAASNSFGAGAAASTSINWQNAPATGTDFCGAYSDVNRVNLVWGGHLDSAPNGGFNADGVLVGRIRVPPNATATTQGLISVVEFIDNAPTQRIMSISPSPCDFRGIVYGQSANLDPTGATAPMGYVFDRYPNLTFGLSSMPGGGVKLVPGQTYYVNIRNRDFTTGQPSCASSSCNVRVTVNPPR